MSIRNRKAQSQFISYDGICYNKKFEDDPHGNFHPMDIDAVLQFSKRSHKEMHYPQAVLLYEYKHGDTKLSVGEEITYCSIADCVSDCGGLGVVIVVSHSVEAPKDVNGAEAIVTKFYYAKHRKWYVPSQKITAKQFTDVFLVRAGLRRQGGGSIMEMTIEKLEKYKGLTSEMKALRDQIDSLYDTYRSPQFMSDGGSHSISAGNPTEIAVEKILNLKETYSKKYEEALDLLEEVEAWFSTVDDVEIRSICRHHYILNKSWQQTSTIIYGYPSYYNARKKVMRYFGREK